MIITFLKLEKKLNFSKKLLKLELLNVTNHSINSGNYATGFFQTLKDVPRSLLTKKFLKKSKIIKKKKKFFLKIGYIPDIKILNNLKSFRSSIGAVTHYQNLEAPWLLRLENPKKTKVSKIMKKLQILSKNC